MPIGNALAGPLDDAFGTDRVLIAAAVFLCTSIVSQQLIPGVLHLTRPCAPPADVMPQASTPVETRILVGGQAAISACWMVETGARARAVSARSQGNSQNCEVVRTNRGMDHR